MAQETAVHRVDVELAHQALTPVDADLAVDGIDELLSIFLAGDLSDEPLDDGDGRSFDVLTGQRTGGSHSAAPRSTLSKPQPPTTSPDR